MQKIEKFYNKKILNVFLLVQPLIDVLTSFMMKYLNTGITIGMVCRIAFILYAIIYLIFVSNKNKKFKVIYFGLLSLYFVGFIITNCINSYILEEMVCFIKYIYYPIILLFLIEINNDNKIFKTLFKTAMILNLLMIISQLFGFTIPSYGYGKIGNSGWFYSANELSVIYSMFFPIIFYKYINKTNLFYTIILIISLICMLVIGTKTTYLSVFITVLIYGFYLIIQRLIYKNKIGGKIKKIIIFIILFTLFTPVMPIYKNMNIHLNILNNNTNSNLVESEKVESNDKISSDAPNLIFYGREKYLSDVKKISKNSNLNQKIFGIGKVVKKGEFDYKYYELELDFHNVIYCYGIFGLIIFLFPQIFVAIKIMLNIRNNKILDEKIYLLLVSVLIAYLVSLLAGHTLLSASPAIYLSYIISLVYLLTNKEKEIEKKNVMFICSVGGHLTQLLEFKKIFNDYNYILITEKTDVTKDLKNKYNTSFLPYGSRNQKYSYPFILMWNCISSLFYLIKYDPDVIITTGANTSAAMCCLGKIFGKKVIFIESFAKRTSPTVTGKSIYKLKAYTVFVVQWESMLEFYPKAQYWGGIY